ncbi:hypothetical protein ANN_00998 [Periplaneta americana]|uniref:Uncharacterized protein n=1 Tax=Periplaneta americana TaxID=6978 RepID=A0ABQ8TWE6_PERAM|nr:hypothetical protein ANN_00998 [Periplaneta americana]
MKNTRKFCGEGLTTECRVVTGYTDYDVWIDYEIVMQGIQGLMYAKSDREDKGMRVCQPEPRQFNSLKDASITASKRRGIDSTNFFVSVDHRKLPSICSYWVEGKPRKNLNQVTCPDRDSNPGHLVSRPDALTVTPQVWTGMMIKVSKGEGETRCRHVAYSYRRVSRGPPGLTSPSDGRILSTVTYVFPSYALRRDLGFNSGILVHNLYGAGRREGQRDASASVAALPAGGGSSSRASASVGQLQAGS